MNKLLAILFCTVQSAVFAQHYSIKLFSEKDGLSNHNVNVLLADAKGFLWAGTDNGLSRFDGSSFDVFQHNPADTNSLAGNKIFALYEDKKQRLWLGTSEGISLYRSRTQDFLNYAPDTFVLKNIGTLFMALRQDDQGRIWVGTNNDLLIFDPQTKRFSSSGWAAFAQQHSLPEGNHLRVVVQQIIEKSADELWVFTTYGLYSVNTHTLQFAYYPFNKPYDYFGSQMKYADEAGIAWISLYGAGLLVYDSRQNNWTEIDIPQDISNADNTYSLKSFSGDTLVFASSGYLVFISRSSHKILAKVAFDESLNKNDPAARCLDIQVQKRSLWLATGKGLIKLTPTGNTARFHHTKIGGALFAVFPEAVDEKMIFSDYSGMYIGDSIFKRITTPFTIFSPIRYFAKDSGRVAYLTDEKDVYSYDLLSGIVKNIPLPPPRNRQNDFAIRNIVVDKSHRLWIRTIGQGIIRYDPSSKNAVYEDHLPDGKNNLQLNLYYDSAGNCLWLSEESNGVYCYDLSAGVTTHFLLNTPPSQRGATAYNIVADQKGNIWMSIVNSGMILYDRNEKVFRHFNISDGLLSDNTSWLTVDPEGSVWISTDMGLSCIHSGDKSITNYPSSEGYPQSNYNFITADKKNNIYLSSDSGYYIYDAVGIPASTVSSSVYLRTVTVNNKSWPLDSVYQFGPGENSLQFLPGVLNLDNPGPSLMEYNLNQNSWITLQKNSAIVLARLSPGSYTLLIRQKNNPSRQLALPFTIHAPVWKRAWFIISICILLAILIFYMMRRRFSSIRKQAALQEEKTKSEIMALRSQMNPHFIFNTLNSINSYIIDKKNEEASDYLTEFSKLIRLTLQHSQQETILLQDELNAVKLYLELECKRLGQDLDYTILLRPDDRIVNTPVPSMIIQPFVENAIWHGLRNKPGDKHILIEIEELNGIMKIMIEDNGIGRAAARSNNNRNKDSFGMASTIRRLQLFDARSQIRVDDIRDNRQQPAGTRITILFKKIKPHEDD